MATFDQLPADQRAIIELVLKRGRTYDQLSDMLQMPEARVRELARLALADLAPVTAGRVDPEWRDQVADYALGQQSGPESAATRGHLRRSEAARAWLGSIVDSLEQLYNNGNQPELPELEGERTRARDRRGRDSEPAARAAAVADADDDAKDPVPGKAGASAPLSDEAAAAVRRRRLTGWAGVAVLVAILLVVLLAKPFSGDDNNSKGKGSKSAADTTTNAQSNARLIGQLALKPVDPKDKNDVGIAQFASDGKVVQIGVQAKLPPSKAKHAYEVWLYNSKADAVSLGAQQVQSNGTFSGANSLPAGYDKYKYIDISDEPINQDKKHSGVSVLRGALADIVTPQQQQQAQGGTGTGTQTTP